MHINNIHRSGYNLKELINEFPILKQYARLNRSGKQGIDMHNTKAVLLLNKILLHKYYHIEAWVIENGYLCPAVPGRADYLHYIADLIPDKEIRILDIGTGSGCIYPLLGASIYDWRFVASEIDDNAIGSAQRNINSNPHLDKKIEIRKQKDPTKIFKGIVNNEEYFDACVCNPPFFESAEQALKSSKRKYKDQEFENERENVMLNFGGQTQELIYEGGEIAFIIQMIKESLQFKDQIKFFTCLVSRKKNLLILKKLFEELKINNVRTLELSQGIKKSRIIVWSFL